MFVTAPRLHQMKFLLNTQNADRVGEAAIVTSFNKLVERQTKNGKAEPHLRLRCLLNDVTRTILLLQRALLQQILLLQRVVLALS